MNTYQILASAPPEALAVIGEQMTLEIGKYVRTLERCKFVDVGCGPGAVTAAIMSARRGCMYTQGRGVDVEPAAIARYNTYFGPGRGITLDLEKSATLPFADNGYDLVTTNLVLELLTLEAERRVFANAIRLAPRFVFGVSRYEGIENCGLVEIQEAPHRFHYIAPIGQFRVAHAQHYEQLCRRAGYKTFEQFSALNYPNLPVYNDLAGKQAAVIYVATR